MFDALRPYSGDKKLDEADVRRALSDLQAKAAESPHSFSVRLMTPRWVTSMRDAGL